MAKLPFISSDIPRDLRQFLDRVREAFDSKGANRVVTRGELVSSGVAGQDGSGNLVPPPSSDGEVQTPPAPTGLTASGALLNIILDWDSPTYSGHAYTEIWAAPPVAGGGVPALGNASLIGQSPGSVFAHNLGNGAVRYYWIRFVNTLGVAGPYNSVTGTKGETGQDPGYLLDLLEGQITESQLWKDLGARIELIDGSTGLSGSVNARIDEARALLDSDISGVSAQLETEQTTRADADSAMASDITALQATVDDPATGVDANATAITNLDTRVTTTEGEITALSTDVTALETTVNDPATGVSANATAVDALETRVTTAEGDITAISTDVTNLQSTVDDPATGVSANATAVSSLETRVTTAEGDITANASDITTLQASVGDNTVAIQTEATTRATETGELYGQYTVKIDLNGYVSGYGLASTNVDGSPESSFIVRADSFAVGTPSGIPGWDVNVEYEVGRQVVYLGSVFASTRKHTGQQPIFYENWNAEKPYLTGDYVLHLGDLFSALRDSTGEVPADEWNSVDSYVVGDEVEYLGSVYVAVADNSDVTPTDTDYWATAPDPAWQKETLYWSELSDSVPPDVWDSAESYSVGDEVIYNSDVYRAVLANTNVTPTNVSYWELIDDPTPAPTVPFIVRTRPTTIQGEEVPVGVYLRDAFIENGTITRAKIGEAAIDTAKIADAAIVSAKIGDAQITTAKIDDGQITTAKIADAAIGTAKIGDAQITTAKIGDGQITNAKIANAAIGTAKIDNAAITTAKIGDGQITNAKIDNAAITNAKIEDAAVTNAKIGDAAITSAKIGDLEVDSAKIADLTVGTEKITGNAVTSVPVTSGNASTNSTTFETLLTVSFVASNPGSLVLIQTYGKFRGTKGSPESGQFGQPRVRVLFNGGVVVPSALLPRDFNDAEDFRPESFLARAVTSAGTNTVSFQMATTTTLYPAVGEDIVVYALELKK